MRLVFFGSPADAVPALHRLRAAGHEVLAAYTRPDRPVGRSGEPAPTPIKVAAQELDIPVRTPRSLRNDSDQRELSAFEADAFVVVAYGRLLPGPVLAMPRHGVVNIHPSLLPEYRGPSPVASAIKDGCVQTGVSLILLDEGMDTGPILAQSDPIALSGGETGGELTRRLFEIGADMLPDVLDGLATGVMTPQPQDDAAASVTKLLERADGELDWTRPADELERLLRAYDPWPGTHTRWRGKTLKVLAARVAAQTAGTPGAVSAEDGHILVATGDGAIELTRLQLEGKRASDAADFLNGNPGIAGSALPS